MAMIFAPTGARAQASPSPTPRQKVTATGRAQGRQLHIEYPEIQLSDKRVFVRARVESFDGISFTISHESGIETVPWEMMPNDWKAAFPRDPARKARSVESALTNERKSQAFVPGSLKPTPEQVAKAKIEAEKVKAAQATPTPAETMQQKLDKMTPLERALWWRLQTPNNTSSLGHQ